MFPRLRQNVAASPKAANVIRRGEQPLERMVITLGAAAAVDVVWALALEPVGHVEDHADEAVRRDLHARGAHDAPLLVLREDLFELAVERVRAGAEANSVLHRHRSAL